jgi:hypothetical protein
MRERPATRLWGRLLQARFLAAHGCKSSRDSHASPPALRAASTGHYDLAIFEGSEHCIALFAPAPTVPGQIGAEECVQTVFVVVQPMAAKRHYVLRKNRTEKRVLAKAHPRRDQAPQMLLGDSEARTLLIHPGLFVSDDWLEAPRPWEFQLGMPSTDCRRACAPSLRPRDERPRRWQESSHEPIHGPGAPLQLCVLLTSCPLLAFSDRESATRIRFRMGASL